jgi:hypothetical protein
MSDTLESRSGQLQYRNLRRCAEADGETNRTDAAIDVELPAWLFVPSSGVTVAQSAEVEAAMNEFQRQLATMSVPGQAQINAQFRRPVKALGIMAQKNIDGVRQDQRLYAPKVILRWEGRAFVAALEVHTD